MAKSFIGQANLPRGLRNNNPGNIRAGDNWRGMISVDPAGFVVFKDISFGIRAMATDLIGDIVKDGLNTIRKLIFEYAPPSENDSLKYATYVSDFTGWKIDERINVTKENMVKLIRAIMNYELGASYSSMISDSEIEGGISIVSSSIVAGIKNFFVDNPTITAVAGLGVLAVLITVALILMGKIKLK